MFFFNSSRRPKVMPRRLAWFENKKKTVHMPEVVLTSHQFHMVIKQLEHLPQMCQKKCTASYQKRLCCHNNAVQWSITQKT